MTVDFHQDLCKGCGVCVKACPDNAIRLIDGKAYIDPLKCSDCQLCTEVCPTGALQPSYNNKPAIKINNTPVEVIQPDNISISSTDSSNWLGITLSLAGRYILPQLFHILSTMIENRFSSHSQEQSITMKYPMRRHQCGRQRRRQRRFFENTPPRNIK